MQTVPKSFFAWQGTIIIKTFSLISFATYLHPFYFLRRPLRLLRFLSYFASKPPSTGTTIDDPIKQLVYLLRAAMLGGVRHVHGRQPTPEARGVDENEGGRGQDEIIHNLCLNCLQESLTSSFEKITGK